MELSKCIQDHAVVVVVVVIVVTLHMVSVYLLFIISSDLQSRSL
jgi:hypothetical protein